MVVTGGQLSIEEDNNNLTSEEGSALYLVHQG